MNGSTGRPPRAPEVGEVRSLRTFSGYRWATIVAVKEGSLRAFIWSDKAQEWSKHPNIYDRLQLSDTEPRGAKPEPKIWKDESDD